MPIQPSAFSLQPSTLIERARDLAPIIRAHRDAIERDRRLPEPVIDALHQAGVFRLWVPEVLGGHEVDPFTYIRVVEGIARVDGSTGWCAMIGAGSGIFGGYLPEPTARKIFHDPHAVLAGHLGGGGQATPVAGGYRVSGRWPFGSGIDHSTWLSGGAIVLDGDRPRLLPDGSPDYRQFFFPTSASRIIDTWSVGGLRGTGSHDYIAEAIDVPDGYSFRFGDPAVQRGPLYRMPLFGLLTAGLVSVALGIARGAIDSLVELALSKRPTGSNSPLRERPLVQQAVAQAEAKLQSGRAFLIQALEQVWDDALRERPSSLRDRALLRLAAVYASDSAAEAVDLVYRSGGASAIFSTNPLERAFRDVHTATQHVMAQSTQYLAAGRAILGLDPEAIPPL